MHLTVTSKEGEIRGYLRGKDGAPAELSVVEIIAAAGCLVATAKNCVEKNPRADPTDTDKRLDVHLATSLYIAGDVLGRILAMLTGSQVAPCQLIDLIEAPKQSARH